MAMNYETARRILEEYVSFPSSESEQREIIVIGTPSGNVKANVPSGRIDARLCPSSQAYRVAQRLYAEAQKVSLQSLAEERALIEEATASIEESLDEMIRREKIVEWFNQCEVPEEMRKYVSVPKFEEPFPYH